VAEVAGDRARVVPDSDPESVLLLASYRNKLLHVFAHEGYALLSLHARGGHCPRALLESDITFLDLLLRRDVIDREDPLSPPDSALTLSTLASAKALSASADSLSASSPSLHSSFCLELVWPFIEAYYFTALFMAVAPSVYPKLDLTASLTALQRSLTTLLSQRRTYAAEALSKETLSHALLSLRVLAPSPMEARSVAERLAPMRRIGPSTLAEDAALLRAWHDKGSARL
jgi:glycerol-3-phosphate O-acyltransferase